MKTSEEIQNRIALIKGLLISDNEGLIKLVEKKKNELRFEVGVLEWVLEAEETPRSEKLKQPMPQYIFRENPKPTKRGKVTRKNITEFIESNPLTTRKLISEGVGIGEVGLVDMLSELINLKKIKSIKWKNGLRYHYYSIKENDKEMENILEERNKVKETATKERIRRKNRENYYKRRNKIKVSQDFLKAKKIKPMLDKMPDEKIVDNEKWLNDFGEKMKDMTAEEKDKLLQRLRPLREKKA